MNKICRICLEEGPGVLSSIFMRNYNISLCDMLEYCCNTKINKNDGLPEQLCSNCICKLGIAYHFKQTCESADIRLRQYLGLSLRNKNYDVSTMTDPITVPPTQQTTIVRKCKCQQTEVKQRSSNYKRKLDSEKLKRGPKPKPKKVHACCECHKEFRCQALLERHVRTHTGYRPFPCAYCPRRFTQSHNLTVHLRVHSGDKPYQCEICSKRFCAQGNLNTHLKIHNGQKDHVCPVCGKSFVTSSEASRHAGRHRATAARPHRCTRCAAAYAQTRDLKLHMLKKHQIPNEEKSDKPDALNTHIDIVSLDPGKEMNGPIHKDEIPVPSYIATASQWISANSGL